MNTTIEADLSADVSTVEYAFQAKDVDDEYRVVSFSGVEELNHPYRLIVGLSALDEVTDSYRHCEEDAHRFDPASCNDSGGQDRAFYQNTASHEFGHYLGCGHYCADDVYFWQTNEAGAYCRGRSAWLQDNIMAVGNEVRPPQGSPWLERLPLHYGPHSVRRNFHVETPHATPEPA